MDNPRSKNDAVLGELLKLKRAGLLLPEDVVEAAKPETSPLHTYFEWDDSEAAHRYRIWQARMLINTRVIYLRNDTEPIRAFVSLSEDRAEGDGYRELVAVLQNADRRQQLLKDAFNEFSVFEEKYNRLKELGTIFAEAKKVRRDLKV